MPQPHPILQPILSVRPRRLMHRGSYFSAWLQRRRQQKMFVSKISVASTPSGADGSIKHLTLRLDILIPCYLVIHIPAEPSRGDNQPILAKINELQLRQIFVRSLSQNSLSIGRSARAVLASLDAQMQTRDTASSSMSPTRSLCILACSRYLDDSQALLVRQ